MGATREIPFVVVATVLLAAACLWFRPVGALAGAGEGFYGWVRECILPCVFLIGALLVLGVRMRGDAHKDTRAADQLQRFFTLAPDAFCIAGTDGYMKRLNPAFGRLLGYTEKEILSRPFVEFVHEEDRDATRLEIEKLGRGIPTVQFANRYRCKDGTYRWFEWNAMPGGERGLIFAAARDVTASKTAEHERKRMEERLNLALEVSNDGLWDWNLETGGVFFSPRWLETVGFGQSDLEPHISAWERLIHPEDLAQVREAREQHFQGSTPYYEVEYRLRSRDGSYRWMLDRGKVVARKGVAGSTGEQAQRMIGVGIDITERKREHEHRLQSERLAAIGEAMTGLSHESGNALQRSQSYLERLRLKTQDHPEFQEAIPEAIEFIGEIQEAQNELLELYERARNYAAPIRVQRHRHDLLSIADTSWRRLEAERVGTQATLRHENPDADSVCRVDRGAVDQIFRNIFQNSLRARKDLLEISVRYVETQLDSVPALCVVLRDNGPGFSAEEKERAFEPFFTTRTKGTGLGMAIVKRLVEAHGGEIVVGNSADGQGAEVLITLPRKGPVST